METRYCHGETQPRFAAVDSATEIQVGDLVYLDTDDAKPASTSGLWSSNLATTQEAFHDKFLGVSDSRSLDGETRDIRVNTSGVFEFDCAAATFELGDLVGPAKASGNALESQKVVKVAGAQLAIGRVAKRYGSNTTRVEVEIISSVMRGGPQNIY